MFTCKDVYIPFAMLPIEARVLFCMLSLAELADHRPWPPSPADIHAYLERVWDAEKLPPADFRVRGRIDEAWRVHLAKHAPNGRRAWMAETRSLAKRRRR